MAKVLSMDDEEIIRREMVLVLERAGYETVAYPDAAPALAEVDFSTIDLVITDLNMPLRGDTAVDVLRARGLTMPVVLISGDLRGDDIRRLRDQVDFFMQKPFPIEEMVDVVGELLVSGQVMHDTPVTAGGE